MRTHLSNQKSRYACIGMKMHILTRHMSPHDNLTVLCRDLNSVAPGPCVFTWAAWYNAGVSLNLMPKGIVFSFRCVFQLVGSCLILSCSIYSVTELLVIRVSIFKLSAVSAFYAAFLLTMHLHYSSGLGSQCVRIHIAHDSLSRHPRNLSHSLCQCHPLPVCIRHDSSMTESPESSSPYIFVV